MGQNSNRDNQPGSSVGTIESVRLDSWKEIASYLHRDARTVRRWERERQLPVHRVPGGERSGVFAYVDELDRWLRSTDALPKEALSDSRESQPEGHAEDFAPSLLALSQGSGTVLAGEDLSATESSALETAADREPLALTASIPGGGAVASTAADQEFNLAALHSKELGAGFANPQASTAPLRQNSPIPNLQIETPRWAFYGMAFLLVTAIVAGSTFAYVHYRRFHRSGQEISQSSPEAKDLYLRGRYFWNLRTESGLNQAIDLFTQSIVNDPHYAPAYAGLADSYLLLRQYGHMSDAEAYPRALAAARQAAVLDPSSPDAHRSIAFILRFWKWDMPDAEKEYLRAIELDPSNSQSHHWYATALLSAGRLKEALTQIDLARALEPQSVSVLADRGLILSFEDAERGAEALRQVEQNDPDFASAHSYLSRIYLNQAEYSKFLSESRIAATLASESDKVAILDQARKDLDARGPIFMLRNLASSYAPLAESGHASAYSVARLFGIAGEPSEAIHLLQMACDRRDPGFLTLESDPAFRKVRTTPEYLALMARKDAMPVAHLDLPSPF